MRVLVSIKCKINKIHYCYPKLSPSNVHARIIWFQYLGLKVKNAKTYSAWLKAKVKRISSHKSPSSLVLQGPGISRHLKQHYNRCVHAHIVTTRISLFCSLRSTKTTMKRNYGTWILEILPYNEQLCLEINHHQNTKKSVEMDILFIDSRTMQLVADVIRYCRRSSTKGLHLQRVWLREMGGK